MLGRQPHPLAIFLWPQLDWLTTKTARGQHISTVYVFTSNGSAFNGRLTVHQPGTSAMTMFAISGGDVVLARDLTAADDGTVTATVTATQNGVSVTAQLTVIIAAPVTQPSPTISLDSPSVNLDDTSTAGTVVSAFTTGMTDGSPFTGDVTVDGPA